MGSAFKNDVIPARIPLPADLNIFTPLFAAFDAERPHFGAFCMAFPNQT